MRNITTYANANIAILTTQPVQALPTQAVYCVVEAVENLTNTELLVDYNTIGLLPEGLTLQLRSVGVSIIYI